jgi:hypothetical protein
LHILKREERQKMKLKELLDFTDDMEYMEVTIVDDDGNQRLSQMGRISDFLTGSGSRFLGDEIELITQDIKSWCTSFDGEKQRPFICITLKNR